MIRRPMGLVEVYHEIKFNGYRYEQLEIDLLHVNKEGRSQYLIVDVVRIVETLLTGVFLLPSDSRIFGKEMCSYFVRTGKVGNKVFKIVFCICSDKPQSIGLITLFRL